MARSKKEKPYSVELIKRGSRKYGEIRTFPDGRTIYVAYRRMKDIFRNGHKTYSGAFRTNEAFWAFDLDILLKMRHRKIQFIGVLVRENDDLYLTRMEWASDPSKTRLVQRGGVLMRNVPFELFTKKPGVVRL